ncbi:MAG: nitrilase-related carbon-nitrogen hydrolase, partial [Alphaproteobacteria bacterium]|nr:nitrilase-related carbon-nitrogen hydrolase [Alphaproteobacteria bacterium]
AGSGAKIVVWPEANGKVDKADEAALIERGRDFARQHRIYLSMALFVRIPGQRLRENKTVTLDPEGEIVSTYFKARPPPGEPSVIGDGVIPVIETPFGVISSVICSDMDSPFHLRQQAVREGIDIMLAPSWDWEEIDPYHTYLSSYRAIENGFSMVRQANDGLSMAMDYQGNVLAAMDHFTTRERVMISQVPMRGRRTIYAQIGDVIAWLCVVALALTIGRTIVRKSASRQRRT